jgi:uncharacterized protein (DUF362 family)
MSRKSNRREFLVQTAVAGAVVACPAGLKGLAQAAQNSQKSRVIIVRNPAVMEKTDAGSTIKIDVLKKMLDDAVAKLTGQSDANAAWKSIFKPEDVVGIKVNCLFGPGAATHPELADAAADALLRIGVKPSNIIIWDRATRDLVQNKYKINKEGDGVRVLANDGVWEDAATVSGSINGRLTKIITRDITALINIPFMKDHGMSGITGALKNHYGSFDSPMKCHGNNCDPYLADLNAIPAIRDKTRLIIMDALRPFADGGPMLSKRNTVWDYSSLLVSRDPVAVDYLAWKTIDEKRKELNIPSLAEAGREPKWIATAASKGLGVNDPNNMEIIKLG